MKTNIKGNPIVAAKSLGRVPALSKKSEMSPARSEEVKTSRSEERSSSSGEPSLLLDRENLKKGEPISGTPGGREGIIPEAATESGKDEGSCHSFTIYRDTTTTIEERRRRSTVLHRSKGRY